MHQVTVNPPLRLNVKLHMPPRRVAPRHSLPPKSPGRLRLFLNSGLGLWVLSTVFVTFGSWAFTQWNDARQRSQQRRTTVERLDQEIQFRLLGDVAISVAAVAAEERRRREANSSISREEVVAFAQKALSPPPVEMQLYPEYGKRGLLSLLKELWINVDSPEDKLCIEVAMNVAAPIVLLAKEQQVPSKMDIARHLSMLADYRWSLKAYIANLDEGKPDSKQRYVASESSQSASQPARSRGISCSAKHLYQLP